MATNINEPLDNELRGILENLAGGLFPLAKWIEEKKYQPPDKDLPWRASGVSLSPKDLGVVPFFEALIRETSADADLIARWQVIKGDPLRYFPLGNPQSWRANRGLDAVPEFGIFEGENLLMDAEKNPISRSIFYADYLPLLKQAAQAAAAQGPIDWGTFAASLFADQSNFWPQGQPRKSSVLMTQFLKDLLYAMLGMRNDVSEPWKFALLIELGEHRRVGNKYTPANAEKAVREFRKVLKQLTQQVQPGAEPVAAPAEAVTLPAGAPALSELFAGMPPVGSPPVNHKTGV